MAGALEVWVSSNPLTLLQTYEFTSMRRRSWEYIPHRPLDGGNTVAWKFIIESSAVSLQLTRET